MRKMLAMMSHRGPDDEGMYRDDAHGVTLGHRRLSIIDTTSAGHQPMVSPDGETVLTFNGEIYNFRALRERLTSLGHAFYSTSDSEVLLAAYREWGDAVVDELVGMYAFAIWDRRQERLFLARDRAGEKPLYYAASNGSFAFASEIQPLLACDWVDSGIDNDALAQYLQYGYVPSPWSIYRGVRKLPPAHVMSVQASGIDVTRYWDPKEFADSPLSGISESEVLEELEAKLTEAVRLQMVSDVSLGAFLSGGVDSSMVVALMTSLGGGTVRTFTIGFDVPDFDESRHASEVARHLGTRHSCERFGMSDVLHLVDSLSSMYGEPFADPSALPTRMVASVARQSVAVSLSGDGADELFGGYGVYDRVQAYSRASRIARPFAGNIMPWLAHLPGKPGRRAQRLIDNAGNDVDVSYRHYFTRSEVTGLLGFSPSHASIAERAWTATKGFPPRRRAMLTDFVSYLPDDVLAKVDRAAMAVSLETRAPFLDHRLVEWTMRLPNRFVRGKYLLKRLLYKYVPAPLVERPKQGFDVPIGQWFRNDLRERLYDALSGRNIEKLGLSDNGFVNTLLTEHMSGVANHDRRLWLLFCLSLWHEDRVKATPVWSGAGL